MLCFVSASEPESHTTGQNPAIPFQTQTRAGSALSARAAGVPTANVSRGTNARQQPYIRTPKGPRMLSVQPLVPQLQAAAVFRALRCVFETPAQGIQAGLVPLGAGAVQVLLLHPRGFALNLRLDVVMLWHCLPCCALLSAGTSVFRLAKRVGCPLGAAQRAMKPVDCGSEQTKGREKRGE